MSSIEKIPLKIEMSEVSGDSKYEIYSRTEIISIFRLLEEQKSLCALYYNDDNQSILTRVLDVDTDDNVVVLDAGDSEAANRSVLDSNKLVFISSLQNVKIQFVTDHTDKISFEGDNAFSVRIPSSVLRLQRREYYRLTTPNQRPLVCNIPHPAEKGKKIAVTIVDISAGGIGVICFEENVPLHADVAYPGCQIELPGIGMLTVNMKIRATFDVTLKDGTVHKRAGCQFMDMPGSMQTLIQRYIMKHEREKKAKMLD